MSPFPSLLDLYKVNLQVGMVMAESNAVVSMRMLGMAGFWSVTDTENSRMISEKVYASTRAVTEAGKVMMGAGRPDEVLSAAMKPIRKETRANAKRLAKRGPKMR